MFSSWLLSGPTLKEQILNTFLKLQCVFSISATCSWLIWLILTDIENMKDEDTVSRFGTPWATNCWSAFRGKSLKVYPVLILFHSHLILVVASNRLLGWVNFWCALKWLFLNTSSHLGKGESLTLYKSRLHVTEPAVWAKTHCSINLGTDSATLPSSEGNNTLEVVLWKLV